LYIYLYLILNLFLLYIILIIILEAGMYPRGGAAIFFRSAPGRRFVPLAKELH